MNNKGTKKAVVVFFGVVFLEKNKTRNKKKLGCWAEENHFRKVKKKKKGKPKKNDDSALKKKWWLRFRELSSKCPSYVRIS